MGITGSQPALMYALGGVARGGATRGGYTSPKVFISIGGVQRANARSTPSQTVRDLRISDALNDAPNTAQYVAEGWSPTVGQDVIVTLGSINNLKREFAGQNLNVRQTASNANGIVHCAVNAIDYTWGLNKRKVVKRYTSTTIAAIAADLVATYAPAYTVAVAAAFGAIVIDEITFTERDLTDALSQLVARGGGYWRCDYFRVVRLFTTDTSQTAPTLLTTSHPSLEGIALATDLSQVVTRAIIEGRGAAAAATVAAGETILPLASIDAFQSGGGIATSGPQRFTYAGRTEVSPGAAPTAQAIPGAGLTPASAYQYAYTDITGAGETVPSPIAAVSTGVVTPPAAPNVGTPTAGSGPNVGTHDYAVTFVTAAGETTGSATRTVATGVTPAPGVALSANTPTAGGSVDIGTHDYEVTFVTAIGETTTSPISGGATTDILSPPTAMTNARGSGVGSSNCAIGDVVFYVCTYVDAAGQTTAGPASNSYTIKNVGGLAEGAFVDYPARPAGATGTRIYRNRNGSYDQASSLTGAGGGTFPDNGLNWNLGAIGAPPGTNTAARKTIPLTNIPIGNADVAQRWIYRRFNMTGTFKFLTAIANNTATTYTDTTANASLGAAAPSSNTAYAQRFPLTIAVGPTGVTSRKIYRTTAGGSQLKLVTTIADNTTTAYTDTVIDASLGANIPTTNTTIAEQIALTGILAGSTGVTARKLYRTAGGGSQLKLVTTIADNTTTTYTDSTADGGLGANAPTADTSGLTFTGFGTTSGTTAAGATAITLVSASAFLSSGGWALIGDLWIRYGGKTATQLTGIPATGTGSIAASVPSGALVQGLVALTGIPASGAGAIVYPITVGDDVQLIAQVDDVAAQTALAALIGGDGIQEGYDQDRRIAYTEAAARGAALLALRGRPEVTIGCVVRDPNAASGGTLSVSLAAPISVAGAFTIQEVAIADFSQAAFPRRTISASTTRFSLNDLLRRIKEIAAA
jgi:hypothetical protein